MMSKYLAGGEKANKQEQAPGVGKQQHRGKLLYKYGYLYSPQHGTRPPQTYTVQCLASTYQASVKGISERVRRLRQVPPAGLAGTASIETCTSKGRAAGAIEVPLVVKLGRCNYGHPLYKYRVWMGSMLSAVRSSQLPPTFTTGCEPASPSGSD